MTTQQVLTETFNSRETYLAWRAEWKRIYAEISADIRVVKLVNKDNCRNPITGWDEQAKVWKRSRPWTDAESKRQKSYAVVVHRSREEHGNSSPTKSDLAKLATLLIARRHWSKEEAQKQYLKAKENPPLVSIC
jgi:hypothetical protein